jgi:DNA repair protein RecO
VPAITDEAICVGHWDFSETSQTVSLFLREHGPIRGIVKGAKRPGGSFEGGIDLLTMGEVVAIVRPGRDLATITEWHVLEIYPAPRRDLEANRAALYMADLVRHMVSEHDPHPRVFGALHEALRALEEPAGVSMALLRFSWTLLCECGYRPRLDRDAQTGQRLPPGRTAAFSAAAGGVVADTGAPDRWRVRRETIELLECVATGNPVVSADPRLVGRANRLLAAYVRELLGEEPRALRWAFPDLARRRAPP